tara:strand:- start:944 stop:2599 length:1656 start_codon:yes stop_codon:yes gene_type:complete
MLTSLKISNYALIEELYTKPDQSFTIITGETGAGKSILLGALGLIIGQRADLNALKDKSKKCIVEAQFSIENYDLKALFLANDLDYDPLTIVRREITPNGKSRAFINDTPVNLNQLKELGDHLIDIHSQHNTLTLNTNQFQLKLIDALAENKQLLVDYTTAYKLYKSTKKVLTEKEASIAQAKAEENFLQFQFDELDQLRLVENEDEELEEEQRSLEHVEDTKVSLSAALNHLINQDENAMDLIRLGKTQLSDASKYNKVAEELNQRLSSLFIELQDITSELELENEKLEYDPERLEYIRERLSSIFSLQKKHSVSSVKELIAIKNTIEDKLLAITNFDDDINRLKSDLLKAEELLLKVSKELSVRRNAAKPILEAQVKELLSRLGMKNAILSVQINPIENFTLNGKEEVQFLFTANKGLEERELSKVASGGELSRLMLAIKRILAQKEHLPTIIFDEIDTGVSGEIADKVGDILKEMSHDLQIISITHLPQMASKGNSHLKVYKEDVGNVTHSYIKELTKDERIEELAKMLSGSKTTTAAIDNAKALLNE